MQQRTHTEFLHLLIYDVYNRSCLEDNYFVHQFFSPPASIFLCSSCPYYSHTATGQQLIGQGEKKEEQKFCFCVNPKAPFCIAHFPPKSRHSIRFSHAARVNGVSASSSD